MAADDLTQAQAKALANDIVSPWSAVDETDEDVIEAAVSKMEAEAKAEDAAKAKAKEADAAEQFNRLADRLGEGD